MKLVLVEWVDSSFAQGWMNKETISQHTVSSCVSSGILVAGNEEQITIVQSAGKDQYGDGITIPKCSIKRIRQLEIKDE